MSFEASWTSQSMPPAACIAPAAVTTARMMSMALPGMEPGAMPKMKTRMNTPRPPQMPRPMPPVRTPMMMQTATTRNSRMNETVSMASPPLSQVAPTETYHAAHRYGIPSGPGASGSGSTAIRRLLMALQIASTTQARTIVTASTTKSLGSFWMV